MGPKALLALITIFFALSARAELIQILHTNDLHSNLDHSYQMPHLGGYGRLKIKIERLREEAKALGVGTIAMDGGDYLEGNMFYMADNGRKSAMAYNMIGYDVAVLGNHDYLMSASHLDSLLRDVPPTMALLAANFKANPELTQINEHLKPVWETVVSGVKVGVIGITLKNMIYKWRIKGEGKISDEVKSTQEWARYLRSRGNEVIIALTHIGITKDRELARGVPELDLIVGGHDHTAFQQVIYQESKNGKQIPIVQAGEFGKWLGRIMLDYNKTTKTMKLEYKLHPVSGDDSDPGITELVTAANYDLDLFYGKEWLETVVGNSSLRPKGEHAEDWVAWHLFINDSMREAVDADFAIHAFALSEDHPVGVVTRRSVYNGNPRHFDLSDKFGYSVYTAMISGFVIKHVAKYCLKRNTKLYFSGITFDWEKKKNGKFKIWNLKHKGEKIRALRRYKVAMSEAIVRGGLEISGFVKYIFHDAQRSEFSMWRAIEEKFKREGEIKPNYIDTYYRKQLAETGIPFERVMIK